MSLNCPDNIVYIQQKTKMIYTEIIQPSVKIVTPESELRAAISKIADMGRICYQSVPKGNFEEDEKFVKTLVERQHESVLEHGTMTVVFVTDRATTHQLVRHRLASYSQESQRYCNYSLGKFDSKVQYVCPVSYSKWNGLCKDEFAVSLSGASTMYGILLENGVKPEDARSVLPQCTKTQIAVTANFREWRTIAKLRCAKNAQASIRALMCALVKATTPVLDSIWSGIEMYTGDIEEYQVHVEK